MTLRILENWLVFLFVIFVEKHVKRGGIYVVEDWGTGYWNSWPDGQSYQIVPCKHSDSTLKMGSLLSRLSRNFGLAGRGYAQRPQADLDFAGHNFGMVGFVKELVDEVGWPDITHPSRGNGDLQRRSSMIQEMAVYHGQVFVVKA